MIKKFKKFWILFFLLAVGTITYSFLPPETKLEAVAHSNPIDRQLSTYSDRNIGQEARVAEVQFKHLTFAEPPEDDYASSQLAATLRGFKFFLNYFSFKSETPEYGTWLWTPTLQITPKYTQTILDEAEERKVNAIYLSLDSYLEISRMPEGQTKERRKKEFEKVLSHFITEANKRGIAVDAEAGWRNWAEPGHEYKPFAIASFVKEFNAKNSHQFRGFQYDIEPYMLETYTTASSTTLANFIKLIDKTEGFLASADDLRFSVVVPAFYDKKDGGTPLVTYRGVRTSVFEHLLKILEKRENNSIIVMSYRNFAQESDGSIEISSNELKTARRGLYRTKIVIAQETGDFMPKYITFHGKPISYFQNETSILSNAFGRNPNFGGLAIHYANAMNELR